MNRADARNEAERARRNAGLADELARLRRRSLELAVQRNAAPEEISLARAGTELTELERDFWVTQALRYAGLAGTKG